LFDKSGNLKEEKAQGEIFQGRGECTSNNGEAEEETQTSWPNGFTHLEFTRL